MSIEPTPPAEAATEPSELDQLIAATGNRYYREPFEKFARDGRRSASWNWAASFFGMYWLFRRGMPAYAIAYLAAGLVAYALIPPWLVACLSLSIAFDPGYAAYDRAYRLAFSFASVVVFPCYADALYYAHLRRLMRQGRVAVYARTTGRPLKGATEYLGYIVGAVLIAVPTAACIYVYQDRSADARILDVLAAAQDPMAKVSEHVRVHGKLPERTGEVDPGKIGERRDLGELRIEPGGTIRLRLTGPDLFAMPNFEGKSIVFTPVVEAGKITRWQCSSDIPDGNLPPSCRKY